ncbi:MAG TPA: TM0106 family RecB-like putative nuclease [Mycobacterium sp.]|nr:TM0106 family RecB-like putative nuclease [Mycobacterium sp.]
MFLTDDRVVYSASDLAAAARCEYALLRSFDAALGRGPAVSQDDALLARTAILGAEHEQRRLDELRDHTGDGVVVIGRPGYTHAGLTAAAEATARAVADRAPVIYQAAMYDGRFAGFADFLILTDGRYRVGDTKLARSAKVEALLQLAAYADTLAASGVPVADEAELVLGDGTVTRYRIDELVPVYRGRRAELERLLDVHHASNAPVRWEDDDVRACFRCPECRAKVREHDDLLLVANMRVSQRARLIDAGVTTMTALAGHQAPVPGLPKRAATALTAQARLQVAPREDDKPPFEVADPQPLALLPHPDRGDMFFDFEGDPLWTPDGRSWGLEYLFGVLGANDEFTPLWAHDRDAERQALRDFLKMVEKRRRRYPGMHIYHYAPYEKTALLRLAGRYGIGEDDVDDLLRNGVLVDLFPLVRKSIRVGTENYSLKSLEPLYMGTELRTGDVTTAADSITEYARYCDLRDQGRDDEAAVVLKQIEEYNRYDCRSTRKLRDWLLTRAFEAGVAPVGPQPVTASAGRGGQIEPEDATERALRAFAGEALSARTPEQTAVAMVAAARGFHQRENKPYWWTHFDRLNNPVDEWGDQTDVFVADSAKVVEDWHLPEGRARKQRRLVRLGGAFAAGGFSQSTFALYDPPAPAGLGDDPDRRASGSVTVEWCDNPEAPTEVLICEREPKSGGTFGQLPFALTPGWPVNDEVLRTAIDTVAAQIAAELPALPNTATVDILRRRRPRLRTRTELPRTGAAVDDITAALVDLDSSYLAVHGPPGTGKTYTAARVIAALVREHRWRIGVVAQSHAVVENLLGDVVAAGTDPGRVAKKVRNGGGAPDTPWQAIAAEAYPSFIDDPTGCVIGGTAWDFANSGRVPPGSLDLLVIEEAGQFNLANTVAVASAARNLLLLGDPQQLPQVSQGTHPEPVDESALGWLIEDHHTLPPERGYFLARSYRMHPAVCAPVSRLAYDNLLRSDETVTAARCLDGYEPGVRVLPVAHVGNSVDSPEEADAIVEEAKRLIGRPWTDGKGVTRPLTARDLLAVTPYNAQVVLLRRRLDEAGLGELRAGTVDKFQGQQAPVVFFSMTASSIDDVPRGISFLLNRNRLNVAVSRAQYAAVIVQSATLTEYLPGTPSGLIDLGAFLTLTGNE